MWHMTLYSVVWLFDQVCIQELRLQAQRQCWLAINFFLAEYADVSYPKCCYVRKWKSRLPSNCRRLCCIKRGTSSTLPSYRTVYQHLRRSCVNLRKPLHRLTYCPLKRPVNGTATWRAVPHWGQEPHLNWRPVDEAGAKSEGDAESRASEGDSPTSASTSCS